VSPAKPPLVRRFIFVWLLVLAGLLWCARTKAGDCVLPEQATSSSTCVLEYREGRRGFWEEDTEVVQAAKDKAALKAANTALATLRQLTSVQSAQIGNLEKANAARAAQAEEKEKAKKAADERADANESKAKWIPWAFAGGGVLGFAAGMLLGGVLHK
jgi:aminoglycoside phosphotransferase (APT) family kinase protein